MAVFADRYEEKKVEVKKKPLMKNTKPSDTKQDQGRLYRITGNIVVGNKHTAFTKEIRAEGKPEALEKAFKELKEQHKVEVYQILVNSVKEGASI